METIDAERVKRAVYNRIDFELPKEVWTEIDGAFRVCWNEIIGFGNEVDRTEVINYVVDWLRKRKVMILESRLTRILDIMFDYIKMVAVSWMNRSLFCPSGSLAEARRFGRRKVRRIVKEEAKDAEYGRC